MNRAMQLDCRSGRRQELSYDHSTEGGMNLEFDLHISKIGSRRGARATAFFEREAVRPLISRSCSSGSSLDIRS